MCRFFSRVYAFSDTGNGRPSGLWAAAVATGFGVFAALIATPSANAQVTAYTSLATFNAAATTSQTYTFEGIASTGNAAFDPTITPLTDTVTGTTAEYYVIDPGYASGAYTLNGTSVLTGGYQRDSTNNSTGTIGFGNTFTAFGTEFGFRNGGTGARPNVFTAQLFNGATPVGALYTSGTLSTAYIGFTSTVPFNRITFTTTILDTSYVYQVFDNIRLGTATGMATPEPGSVILFNLGLLGVVAAVRRRHVRAS